MPTFGLEPTRPGTFDDASLTGNAARLPTGQSAVLAWLAVVLVAGISAAAISRGIWLAWACDGDMDAQQRAYEYATFRQGTYPNRAIAGPSAPADTPYSVYPPYAIPMFAVFFEPGGLLQGRVVIESLSLLALFSIGVFGWQTMRHHAAGPALAMAGGVAAAAIGGNGCAFAVGQFSIICVGLIVRQIAYLQRGQPIAAGICWALAMLKPHIALPFAALFLIRRQWRGLAVGALILAALGAFACWWTGVSLQTAIRHWLFGMSLKFTESANSVGPAALAARLGLDARRVQVASLGVLGCLAAAAAWLARRHSERIALLPAAGVCALLGQLLLYHFHYDNIMLFPAVISLLAIARSAPSWLSIGAASLMGVTVLLPQSLLDHAPALGVTRALVWAVLCAGLVAVIVRRPATVQQ